MKFQLLFCFILFFPICFFGQKEIIVTASQKVIGKNLQIGNNIQANVYDFPDKISDFYFDSISNILTVKLQKTNSNGKILNNNGLIIQYDLKNNSILWTEPVNYNESYFVFNHSSFIQIMGDKSFSLDVNTGAILWEIKNALYFTDSRYKLGIGYKISSFSGTTDNLEAIDLSTGKRVWQRQISSQYGWNKIFYLNDSVVGIVAGGLHTVNLNNGKGWSYNTITGVKDYTPSSVFNTIGIAAGLTLGVLTGAFVFSMKSSLLSNLISNVLISDSLLYFASKEKISCLAVDGKVNWSYTLPEDMTSCSEIYMEDSILFMINHGYATLGSQQINYGIPYLTAFNKITGKRIFFSSFNDKKNPILSYKYCKNFIYLLFKNKIIKCSKFDGSVVSEKNFDTEIVGELNSIIDNSTCFFSVDDSMRNIVESNSSKLCVYTGTNNILVLDDTLDDFYQLQDNQVYHQTSCIGDNKLLSNNLVTSIINKDNKEIARLIDLRKTVLIGNKLISVIDKSLFVTDITELIKNNK